MRVMRLGGDFISGASHILFIEIIEIFDLLIVEEMKCIAQSFGVALSLKRGPFIRSYSPYS